MFVLKRNAKHVKNELEKQDNVLHKDFRMTPAVSVEWKECIAVPIIKDSGYTPSFEAGVIMGYGRQYCPYSTSLLGNHQHRTPRTGHETNSSSSNLTLVQRALLSTADVFRPGSYTDDLLVTTVESLSLVLCPKKLEKLGDDNTLVVPRRAFDGNDEAFRDFVRECGYKGGDLDDYFSELWKQLASYSKSPRVVRKGEVDPESGVRESGYRMLWPFSGVPDETGKFVQSPQQRHVPSCEYCLTQYPLHIAHIEGPDSPSWITVTEQGIRQSFDLTRVMFSRGNVSEKIRFGKLVQKGETVLDLYAGIGYFSLPALVRGQAAYLYACEWNPNAVEALQFNLQDNGVMDRATVYTGDCRESARSNKLVNMVDRVSLGLLPSSQGGWQTAVAALRNATGGWLHVHANVPVKEVDAWSMWLCCCLREFVRRDKPIDWVVLCFHVEKVKSFAPTVNHYVADVFVGPVDRLPVGVEMKASTAGVLGAADQKAKLCPAQVTPPSCALSHDGVLHQDWMR